MFDDAVTARVPTPLEQKLEFPASGISAEGAIPVTVNVTAGPALFSVWLAGRLD